MMTAKPRHNYLQPILVTLVASSLAAVLTGCAGLAIGAGATVVTAAAEERGVKAAARDLTIATSITALWAKTDARLVKDLDVTVSEGRVLLTGTVATRERRLKAVKLVWRISGIKTVHNEIQVRPSGGIKGLARDSWITSQLVSRLSFDGKVTNINYSVETVNRVVYLMGIAQNQSEINRVRSHAKRISYVRRVVSHVRLKNDAARHTGQRPASRTKQ
jgi:osmotically-inducible protein OsmY